MASILLQSAGRASPGRLGADVRFCVPEPAVRRSLLEFESLLNRCGRQAECWEKERAVLESALDAHSTDPHLHRAYQDLFKRWTPSDRSVEPRDLEPWYRGLVEQEPENPTYLRRASGPAWRRRCGGDVGFAYPYEFHCESLRCARCGADRLLLYVTTERMRLSG